MEAEKWTRLSAKLDEELGKPDGPVIQAIRRVLAEQPGLEETSPIDIVSYFKKPSDPNASLAPEPSGAYMKPVQPDAALAAVIGDKAMPRTQVIKLMWVYIKKNGLQDAKKRIMINADDKLLAVFSGKQQVSMFEMVKLVSNHLKG